MARIFGKNDIILEHSGEIVVNATGLWTGSARFRFPKGAWDKAPRKKSAHPMAPFLLAETVRIVFTPGLWTAVADYAGIGPDGDPSEPVYELSPGVGTEPIETHKDFSSVLAGTPAEPLNGAMFVDPQTGWPTKSTELGKYEFLKFAEAVGDVPSPMAGVKSFLDPNNTFWIKRWTQKAKPAGNNVMAVEEPEGPCPSFGGGYNWLAFPLSMQGRGGAWACEKRWMLSGRKGWNAMVYPGS